MAETTETQNVNNLKRFRFFGDVASFILMLSTWILGEVCKVFFCFCYCCSQVLCYTDILLLTQSYTNWRHSLICTLQLNIWSRGSEEGPRISRHIANARSGSMQLTSLRWSIKPCKVNFPLLIKSPVAQSAAGCRKINILLMECDRRC